METTDKIALDADEMTAKAAHVARLTEVKDWLDATYQDMQSRYDNRGEKWQESAAGQAASEWIEEFDSIAGEIETLAEKLDQLARQP